MSSCIWGYDEFGEDAYNTQGQIQPLGYTGYRYDRDGKTPEMASNYSQVFDILKTGTEMAGAAALADSPAPGPMDLVALGILCITLVVSGGVAVGTYINSTAKEKEKARVIAL